MVSRHQHGISRRGFCFCCVSAAALTAAGGIMTPGRAFAEARGIVDTIKDAAAKAPINIHRIRGNIAVLEGSGGNVAVLSGADGKLLVDAGIAVSRPQMETALDAIGPGPVTRLINTHWHFDHADGNAWLHEARPTITAHENARCHLSHVERVEDWNFDFPPLPDAALPTDVFASEHVITFNGSRILLRYYGPAHTDSDISVLFQQDNVLHTGDTFWNGVYPFIDYSTGGSIDGSIRAAEANLKLADDNTIVIPGHGSPIGARPQLVAFHQMLVGIRGNVAALKRQGASLDAILAAKPTAAFDKVWGQYVIGPDLFTRLVYHGV